MTPNGSLRYAATRTLEHRFPAPTGTEVPAVGLHTRGRSTLGTKFFTTLARFACHSTRETTSKPGWRLVMRASPRREPRLAVTIHLSWMMHVRSAVAPLVWSRPRLRGGVGYFTP
jgi:hypothetical protein